MKTTKRTAGLLAAGLLAATLGAQAQQTYTWDNEVGNHLWSNPTNWVGDPALTFNNQTDLIFDDASVSNRNNAVSIGGGKTIRSLTINANYETGNNATFDIRLFNTIGATPRNLAFAADSGNASINVAQSTSGTVQVRLGGNTQGTVILNSNLDLAQNNTFFGATGFQFDGSVSGAGTINKTGAGLVRMVRDNSNWSGGMNINEGEVSVFANPNNMGTGAWTLGGGANNTRFSAGSVAVQNNTGGIVVADGAGTRTIALMSTTVGTPTLAGAITLNKDAVFDVGSYVATTHDRLTAQGVISGTGGLTKTGGGILVLSGTNTYSGTTTVVAGTLVLAGSETINDLARLVLGADTAFTMDFAGVETVEGLSLDGGSTWLANGTYDAAALGGLGSGTYGGTGSIRIQSATTEIGEVSIQTLGSTNVVLEWGSEIGFSYGVEGKTDLVFGNWEPVASNFAGTGGLLSYTGSVAEAKSFYRIVLE